MKSTRRNRSGVLTRTGRRCGGASSTSSWPFRPSSRGWPRFSPALLLPLLQRRVNQDHSRGGRRWPLRADAAAGMTIAIPNWNHELVLPRSVASALDGVGQLARHDVRAEVLVIDDASRDGSLT